MRFSSFAVLAVLTSALVACGDDTSGTGGGGGTTSSSSTSSSGGGGGSGGAGGSGGGAALIGDCVDTTDCDGLGCFELTPGGFRVCESDIVPATSCNQGGVVDDECCESDDCTSGTCHKFTDLPYCGGAPPPEYNVCVSDQCANDTDCQSGGDGGVCLPAGVLGQPARVCMRAYCRTNADCTAEPGGTCAPIADSCCSRPVGLGCVYASGCRSDNQCPNGHCVLDDATGRGTCAPGPAACPP